MKLTAKSIFDDIFRDLLHLIDTGIIKAGSEDELRYLQIKSNYSLRNFCAINRVVAPCEVKIVMPKSDLEQIRFVIDSITTKRLKDRLLLD